MTVVPHEIKLLRLIAGKYNVYRRRDGVTSGHTKGLSISASAVLGAGPTTAVPAPAAHIPKLSGAGLKFPPNS